MSTPIKTGWLKDNSGDKFAPKTLSSQVQTVDGILLEDKLQDDLNAAKAEILDSVIENIDLSVYETKEDAQNKLAEAKVYVDEQITNHKYSYNDLTDKPFYEETEIVNEPLNITWDGNTEGLVSINNQFYKVSDLALTDEEIKLSTIEFNNILMPIGDSWEEGLANGQVIPSEEATFAFLIIVARKDKAIISNGTIEIEIPEKGIYFGVNPGGYVSALTTTEPIEQTKTVVHKLDEKYLPDGATVYYGDDVYLYHDSAQTRKVTKEELRVAYQSGTIYIYANTYTEYVTDLHLALCVNVDSSRGYVSFMWGDSTKWKTLYTTEYVGTES